MIQLKFNPKWLFMSNGANSPTEFPDKVGARNTEGVFTSSDWFPALPVAGNKEFIAAYIAMYGGDADGIDGTSAEAYSAGMILEQVAKKTGTIDNATIIKTLHSGTWHTLVGDLSWDADGAPNGEYLLDPVGRRQAPHRVSRERSAAPAHRAEAQLGRIREGRRA